MHKVGIYLRLSAEDINTAVQESYSIGNQRDLLMEYIKENNLKFVSEYIDDGLTGTNFNRPAFQKMLNDIELGLINMVITKDLSRLGRNYIETGYYIDYYFIEHNVRYVSLLDNFDTYKENSENDLMPFKSVLNELYCKDISEKIKTTKYNKMKQGICVIRYGALWI